MSIKEGLKDAGIIIGLAVFSLLIAVVVYAVVAPEAIWGTPYLPDSKRQYTICPLSGRRILKKDCPMAQKKLKKQP